MNRKEVRDFVTDDKNWEALDGNDYIRLEILRIGSLAFGQIAMNEILNRTELILHPEAAPKYGFRRQGYYYELDEENHLIGFSISLTSLLDRVWKEDKK